MKYKGTTAIIFAGLISMIALLIVFSMPITEADTSTDDNVTMTVGITNQAPTVATISCSPTSLTPTAASNTTITCAANVTDNNGQGDITQADFEANIWLNGAGVVADSADDTNIHYSNGTGSNIGTNCAWVVKNATTIQVTCTFNTRHFISPGTWYANFTANDTADLQGSIVKTDYTVNAILGLDSYTETIDFSTLALGATSAQQTQDIVNTANSPMDVQVAETANAGFLSCTGTGSDRIATSNTSTGVRYNVTTGFAFVNGTQLSGTQTTNPEFSLNYYNATGVADGLSSKSMYWLLVVPQVAVGGTCTGTLTVVATANV